jgi:hypothetical protein
MWLLGCGTMGLRSIWTSLDHSLISDKSCTDAAYEQTIFYKSVGMDAQSQAILLSACRPSIQKHPIDVFVRHLYHERLPMACILQVNNRVSMSRNEPSQLHHESILPSSLNTSILLLHLSATSSSPTPPPPAAPSQSISSSGFLAPLPVYPPLLFLTCPPESIQSVSLGSGGNHSSNLAQVQEERDLESSWPPEGEGERGSFEL